jgi:hypothetical protein
MRVDLRLANAGVPKLATNVLERLLARYQPRRRRGVAQVVQAQVRRDASVSQRRVVPAARDRRPVEVAAVVLGEKHAAACTPARVDSTLEPLGESRPDLDAARRLILQLAAGSVLQLAGNDDQAAVTVDVARLDRERLADAKAGKRQHLGQDGRPSRSHSHWWQRRAADRLAGRAAVLSGRSTSPPEREIFCQQPAKLLPRLLPRARMRRFGAGLRNAGSRSTERLPKHALERT